MEALWYTGNESVQANQRFKRFSVAYAICLLSKHTTFIRLALLQSLFTIVYMFNRIYHHLTPGESIFRGYDRKMRLLVQVSEVLEAGKTMYKELSNDFEERVIALVQIYRNP